MTAENPSAVPAKATAVTASAVGAKVVKANVVDLTEKDLPELAAFVAAQSGKDPAETISHLTWLLLENPAHGQEMPLGCGARSSEGSLVGCILYLPQRFVFRAEPLEVLGSSSFYVEESYRGSGGAIFLKFARAAQRLPLFGNSANAIAAQLWKARGATPIANSDHELLGVMHWPAVVEEVMLRRGKGKKIARAVGAASGWMSALRELRLPKTNGELISLLTIEQAAEITRGEPSDVITALRDRAYLQWRYDTRKDPSVATFAFSDHTGEAPVFVAVNERPRGHRGQIRALNVLDIFPKPKPATTLAIVAALEDRYRDRTDMIVLRGQDEPSQEALIAAGFRRRNFEAPNGWIFDPRGIVPGKSWYFVPADGDWLI
jgi:hypothetical protein